MFCVSGVVVLHITHNTTCQIFSKCLIKHTSYLWATYLPRIGAIKEVSIGVFMCPSTGEASKVK